MGKSEMTDTPDTIASKRTKGNDQSLVVPLCSWCIHSDYITWLSKWLCMQNRPTRCSEPLRYKVGGASKPSPDCAGWDRMAVMGISLQLYCWKWVHGGGLQVKPTRIVPHCSIALHLSPLEWGILFLFYFWEDYLWRGAHQGYGRNLMTAIDHMFQNGTKEQCPIC